MNQRKYLIILALTAMTLALSGCGNQAEDAPANTASTEIAATESVEANPDATATEEVSVDETTETTETITEEPAPEETMEDWLTEVGKQGTICMAVWNDTNSTKHIIENDETYEMKERDRFFICTPSKFKESTYNIDIEYSLGKPSDNYLEVRFGNFLGEESIGYEILCSDGEEGTIDFTLVSSGISTPPSTTDDMNDFTSISIDTENLGFYWAIGLNYDTPQMLVWNDTNGSKQELENPATYQLCEDDQLALYFPNDYIVDRYNIDSSNTETLSNIFLIDLEQMDLGEKFDLEITTRHVETLEAIPFNVTLLPVQQ